MIKSWLFEFMHVPGSGDVQASPEDVTKVFDASMALWQEVEQLGFEGVFFSEHHFLGLSYSPSPNLLIAALAQRTTRLRLGTMGMVLPFYEPWRILEEIGMLDHLSGGRLEIGCAAGIPQELSRAGHDPDDARARFNELLDIVDAGLAGGEISYNGEFYRLENLRLLPKPRQQPAPPVWTTVVSEPSAKKAARRGSKICTGFQSTARISQIFDAYRDEASRLGGGAGPDQMGIRRNVSIAAGEAEAREMDDTAKETARKILAGDPRVVAASKSLLDAPEKGAGFTVHEDEFIFGTPDQVAEQIVEQCRGCGAGHFLATVARGSHDKRAAAVRLFGERVVPILLRAGLDRPVLAEPAQRPAKV